MGMKGAGVKNGGRKLKSINDNVGYVIVVSRSSVDGVADGTIIGEVGKPSMVHKKVTCDNVADFFWRSTLSLLRTFDDFTRRIRRGAFVRMFLVGLNKGNFEQGGGINATMVGDEIMALECHYGCDYGFVCLLEKFSANMSNLADNSFGKEKPANVKIDSVHKPDIPIVQSVFIPKSVSYVRAAGALSIVSKKGRANFCPLEYENVCDGVDLTILIKVVEEVHNNWGKYGLTRLMMNSKGFFFFKFDSRKGFEDVLENGCHTASKAKTRGDGDLSLEAMDDKEVTLVDGVFEGAFGALGDEWWCVEVEALVDAMKVMMVDDK
ncbi:hypothetical protein Tco_1283580 [Tanacetum coccineum]